MRPGPKPGGAGDGDDEGEHAPSGDVIDGGAGDGDGADVGFVKVALGEDSGENGEGGDAHGRAHEEGDGSEAHCGGVVEEIGVEIEGEHDADEEGGHDAGMADEDGGWPRLRMSLGSSSRPMRKRKKMTPTWLRAFEIVNALSGEDLAGRRRA